MQSVHCFLNFLTLQGNLLELGVELGIFGASVQYMLAGIQL